MARRIVSISVLGMLLAVFSALTWSQEKPKIAPSKLKIATAFKQYLPYYLLIPAAEEKGFWRENGLEVEWIPFYGSAPTHQAVAAGSVKVGMDFASGTIQGISRGVPIKMVAHMQTREEYFLWTRADSPRKSPLDIKGAKIGVVRFGGPHHAYGRAVARALGVQREVKFVSLGGAPQMIAALKTGAVDGIIIGLSSVVGAQLKGEIRPLLSTREYLREPWLGIILFAENEFLANNPETVKRVVRALVAASNFIRQDRKWAISRIMEEERLSERGANISLDGFDFTTDGRIEPKAVENLRAFLMENGIVPKEKMPPTHELYIPGFWG